VNKKLQIDLFINLQAFISLYYLIKLPRSGKQWCCVTQMCFKRSQRKYLPVKWK